MLTSQRDLDLEPRLGELTMPVEVLHGDADPVRTTAAAADLAAAIPGARLTIVGAGHTPVFETPDQAAAVALVLADRASQQRGKVTAG